MPSFDLTAPYFPKGDQPTAINQLVAGVNSGERYQTLLGATGTGKTFTMANVIAQTGRPALVLAHNKTLAAQLCNELREFSPRTPLSTSFPTTTTTNRRPTYRSATLTLPRRRRLTRRSTCCATRQRGRCSNGVM